MHIVNYYYFFFFIIITSKKKKKYNKIFKKIKYNKNEIKYLNIIIFNQSHVLIIIMKL